VRWPPRVSICSAPSTDATRGQETGIRPAVPHSASSRRASALGIRYRAWRDVLLADTRVIEPGSGVAARSARSSRALLGEDIKVG